MTEESKEAQIELSPIEQLPPSLFCEIAKYLVVVEYDDENEKCDPRWRPFLCRVRLKRGYALAVCSRRCNELFEESAKNFVGFYLPKNYFLPHVPIDEESSSHLARFYHIKGLEVKFRYASKCLQDFMGTTAVKERGRQNIQLETDLIRHAERVLSGPLVHNYACGVLLDCTRACARSLHVPNSGEIQPDPKVAEAAAVALDKIVTLRRLLAAAGGCVGSHYARSPLYPLSLLYFAWLKATKPNYAKAEQALLELLRELADPAAPKTAIVQDTQLKAFRTLFRLYMKSRRLDDCFDLMQRARMETKGLDPVHIWTCTGIVADYASQLGLARSITFVSEAVDELNCVQLPSEELRWRTRYNAADWHRYRQGCSTRLRELRDRQGWGEA
ncbi:expressed unknown protein [Seminavis robusta]|uniref:Uncharacterized protein n=1 Tax=Seminavis robusta TaxID=568900 RepID=A0A9N8E9J1_9STRA|nr:expressed unknown protein [Seminavis robusta]|eukprot:Sro773_g200560.1 n/a (387) ;mRNA; r:45927-47087